MSGMIDGVSKVWIVRQSPGGGLEVMGYKNDKEAVVGLARNQSYAPEWMENMIAMRKEIQREIRNERARRRRERD